MLCFLAGLGLPAGSAGSLTLEDLDIDGAIAQLRRWSARFEPATPFDNNPAKQLALFLLYGVADAAGAEAVRDNLWQKRTPFVLADRNNAALAHEVRTQIHERSKVNAACYEAPEFLHNLVESVRSTSRSSQAGLDDDRWVYYFIRSSRRATQDRRAARQNDRARLSRPGPLRRLDRGGINPVPPGTLRHLFQRLHGDVPRRPQRRRSPPRADDELAEERHERYPSDRRRCVVQSRCGPTGRRRSRSDNLRLNCLLEQSLASDADAEAVQQAEPGPRGGTQSARHALMA